MRILFLSHWYPYPPDNGSKLRIYNLLRGLSTRHRVTLISFSDEGLKATPPELEEICDRVWTIPVKTYRPASVAALRGLFSFKPRVLVDKFVPQMAQQIRQEVTRGEFDLVIASQWYMADYTSEFREIPAIFEEVEVGVFIQKKLDSSGWSRALRSYLTEYKLRGYLRDLLPRFKSCTVVSNIEQEYLSRMVPDYKNIQVISNGVSLEDYDIGPGEPRRNTLIYTGSFRYSANYEAMLWFVQEVLPRIKLEVPDVHLTITGDHGNLPFPECENVALSGFVPDIRPLVASSWISIAPLLVGGGTRLKILEAMALRTPVVSTSKGVEGLRGKNGEHLLIADSSDDFAREVVNLLKDAELRRELTDNAYQLVRQQYDWKVILPEFLDLVEQAGGK